MDRETVLKAAKAMEGEAILLDARWDRALVGYSCECKRVDGSAIALGVYDYGKAIEIAMPYMGTRGEEAALDAEDCLLDALNDVRTRTQLRPLLIHMEGRA